MEHHDPFQRETDRLLKDILRVAEVQARATIELAAESRITNRLLMRLLELEGPKPITGFTFTRIGDTMLPIDPGQQGLKWQATPTPAGATLPSGANLVWASDDANVTVSQDPTDASGLTVVVNISTAATVGEVANVSLTATGTNADGSPLQATGSFQVTVGAAPSQNVTGFTFTQVS